MLIGGRYRVEGRLGTGGAGEVLKVVEQPTGRTLALKRLAPGTTDPRKRRQDDLRFRREYHVLANLRHPCIVRVHDYGVDPDGPWYTMELLEGPDLRDAAPVPWRQTCRITRDVAAGLAHLHARRLLHRDVAPRNVRCTREGDARLLDFGVLATMGPVHEVAGTPPCIAPEALRKLPLDQRTDLYGLGCLAYFLLTGRFAYPARSIHELETLWRRRPPPPGELLDDIPAALDELVMSLISLDPLGRPADGAEVVDRLGGIASLGPPPEIGKDRRAFGSAALVGRRRELERIRHLLRATEDGEGAAVVLEGPGGSGKSRLLRELALQAKVAGLTVGRATGDSGGRGPYGVLQELTHSLLETAADSVLEAAAPHAPMLVRVLPALAIRFASVEPAALSGDPAEDRLRLHQAFVAWLTALAGRRALVLLVDDAQRGDEASMAVLASLGYAAREHHLLVGIAVRTDEPTRAPSALRVLLEAGHRLPLHGLAVRHLERMLRSLFGGVPNLPALAERMHSAVGGNPLLLTELVRHLVEQGLVRYVDGMWVLPAELRRRDLPDGLTETLDARVRQLPRNAQELGKVLSLHEGPVTLEQCVALRAGAEDETFEALDALLAQEVLYGSGYTYRFQHDGLREAFRRSIDPRRLPRLHLALGRALLATTGGSVGEVDIGWHLLRGGDVERGSELLERAGKRLFESQSFADAIAPLEEALAVHERHGGSARKALDLRHMLLVSGVMADRSVLIRHADRTIARLRQDAGATAAAKLAPLLGRHLGLAVGVGWAGLRWLFSRPSKRGLNPVSALSRLFVSVTYAATAFSLSFDHRRTRILADSLAPLAVLKKRMLHAAYLITLNFHEITLGRFESVRDRARAALAIAERDRLTPISEADRAHGIGAALYMLAATHLLDQDRSHERWAERLEGMGLRFFEASGQTARALFHRLRGEEEQAEQLMAEADRTLIQLGSAWILDSQRQWASGLAYALTRDLLGLRRSTEALVRLTDDGYRLEAFVELTRGEYYRERGELDASLRAIDAALELAPPGDGFVRQAAASARAETLLAAARPEEAMRVARQGIGLAEQPDYGRLPWKLRCARVLALAEAALGDQQGAAARLDALIAEARPLESPSLCGSLHEARARVALLLGDRDAYTLHRDETRRWFRGTRNPALVARADRLVEAGGGEISTEHAVEMLGDDVATVRGARRRSMWVSEVIDRCADADERAERALEVILQETGAREGHLYLLRDGGLAHAAPQHWKRPPDAVVEALAEAVEQARADPGRVTEQTVVETPTDAWYTIPLVGTVQGHPVCAGAAALAAGDVPPRRADPAMLDAVVRKLRAHHDVVTDREATSG